MVADCAREGAIFFEFGVAVATGRIHFVASFPGEIDTLRAVPAIEPSLDGAKCELTAALAIEADEGGLDQSEEVDLPLFHLGDPPPPGDVSMCLPSKCVSQQLRDADQVIGCCPRQGERPTDPFGPAVARLALIRPWS